MIRAKLETLSSLKNLISNSLKENLEYDIVLDLWAQVLALSPKDEWIKAQKAWYNEFLESGLKS